MKQKTHRLLSLLLCLVMVLGLLPATPAMASEPGRTEDNPVVCKTFDEFKAAMQGSAAFVKLAGGYFEATVTGSSIQNAVYTNGNKTLIVEGYNKFVPAEGDQSQINSLIAVGLNNNLTIQGTGQIEYWHENFLEAGAVICLEATGASLTVNGEVTIKGYHDGSNVHGRAIYATTGTVTINGGKFVGDDARNEGYTAESSVVTIKGDASLKVNGGTFMTGGSTQCDHGVYINTTGDVQLRAGTFQNNGITIDKNVTIADSGCFTGATIKTGIGYGETSVLSDWNQNVSVLKDKTVVLEYPYFIRDISATVTKPADGASPVFSATAGDDSYTVTVDRWYDGGTAESPNTMGVMSASDTFVAGQPYVVKVEFKPKEGYVILPGYSAAINGVDAVLVGSNTGTGAVYYRVALTAQPNVLTGRVQFTSAANPGKPIGMVLVDGTVKDVNSTALNYQWQIKVDDTWLDVGTDRNYSPAAADLGRQIRVIITADGYEGSIVSGALTVAKAFNPASPSKAPDLEARQAGPSYTTLRVYTKAGQDYVWRDSQEADPKAINWSVNAFTKPADANYVDITGLTEGTTYYVYTRISETESTKAGVGVKYSSLLLKTPDFLQKVVLEGYTDYGDGNTIYIPVGQTVTINVEKYPADASTWSYFTFGDPSLSTYIYEVTDPTGQVQETMPTRIMLKGNNVGTGTLKAYYNGGMYDYGSWRVIVYDTLQAGQVTFTDKPAYDDISLYVGDSYTPTAPASGLLLPTEANDGRFEYRWYLYEGTDSISGSPYGTTTNNGYLSIDPETGKVTALSANRTGTHQPYVKLCLVDKEDTSKYQVVTEYKVTVASNGEIPVDGVTVVPTTTTMAPGTSMMPTAVVSPSNHTETGSVVWSKVSGSDSITIDPVTGKVTVSGSAVDGDTATIRATFGDKYGECVITVSTSHTASGDWQKSSTDHWKVCGCGTILDKAAHDYGDDNVCDTCGYTKTSGGNPTDPTDPTDPAEPTDPGQKPDSPETGDNSNLFLWAALLFVSGCGIFGATIYGKKKKENAE